MTTPRRPTPHPSGARPPALPPAAVPQHVALVMDGNGRWAKARGLPRTEGHKRGEAALFDVVEGAIEIGVKHLSAYAFSTENWKRSPDEVRFLMGFNRDVIRRRRDEMHSLGVRVRWAGRRPRLWRSVVKELEIAEQLTAANRVLTPDDEVWMRAGVLTGLLTRIQGYQAHQRKELLADALIYLSAAKACLPVLTRNAADFDLLNQLYPAGRVIIYG